MKLGQSAEAGSEWKAFLRKYQAEMSTPENSRTLDLPAALSNQSNFCLIRDIHVPHPSGARKVRPIRLSCRIVIGVPFFWFVSLGKQRNEQYICIDIKYPVVDNTIAQQHE
jgi:hypothetical protein